ncbi:hypothetical protein NX794_31040 [Streptomyces sp. LP11]|uniref:Uncharacterized protein n=1 Tax=Streptomyces pyxinicus TaxID=2970331 RepID=A0ABT2BAR4_9ACTN|nr:hypothetical protein [Streptomyces sp. LP11]MCS0605605.1 hypothetical protein [Streptomyces sp. LP11]
MPEGTAKAVLVLEGRVTGTRVLEARNGHDVLEISFSARGTFAGHEVEGSFTYEQEAISVNTFVGSGRAVLHTADGEGTLSLKATGATKRKEGATGLVWRVYAAVQSAAPTFAQWDGQLLDMTATIGDDQKISLRAVPWT